ncbi:hypothetical protein LTR62_001898 [Meristemomyces frigidus]|uniref:Uncharacterized protein n=1 Tax=Meristemomyces frigidus TaxID=1508187 RepID=A0AAN7T8P5_9PEZI|nr:hypothetical protein LTR62_001898 [Meristemomyces frigidus]
MATLATFASPTVPGAAIVAASLLSGVNTGSANGRPGAMLAHGLNIPVLIDTRLSPARLISQWARTFHYGHVIMPPLAISWCTRLC